MDIVLFETGGGLITYRKSRAGASEIMDGEAKEQDKKVLFVHTLNTESGMIRKLLDLKIEKETFMAAISRSTLMKQRSLPLVIILAFLESSERSRKAAKVVTSMHHIFA